MRSPILDYLDGILDETAHVTEGSLADYIPELAEADPERAAVALSTINGTVYATGDDEVEFSIQSMSKALAYALALEDNGVDAVMERVSVEPSGEAFNELSLDDDTGRPLNPMINAGAIATHALIHDGDTSAEERLYALYSKLAGREIRIDEGLAASELRTGDRNIGLAYLLHSTGALTKDPRKAVEGYIRQCSALVTVQDLALMASTLANGGIHPLTEERIFCRPTVRQVLSVMATSGMYDAAGDWFTAVGIPAKSGVAGGIIGVLPGQVGLAVFSPRLDVHGNSARGVAMMEKLSDDMGLHLMDASRPARSSLREKRFGEVEGEGSAVVYVLQGDMVLSSIESLVHDIITDPPGRDLIVFDLSRVDEIRPVAMRTSIAMARKLLAESHRVVTIDPDDIAEEFASDETLDVQVWTREELRERFRETG